MKFEIKQENLIKALSNLTKNTNQQIEVYKFIQIEAASGDRIILKSNNGITSLSCKLKAFNVSGETQMIEGRKFYELVSKLKGNISFNDGTISCGKSLIKLNVINESYFKDEEIEFDKETVIDLKEFRDIIRNRLFACSKLETNLLNSLCINKNEVVATDGNLLSLGRLKTNTGFENLLLHRNFAEEILRNFEDEKINFSFNKQWIEISNDSTMIRTRTIVGTYPKYQAILPNYNKGFCIDKQNLIEALDLILTMANDRTFLCVLNISKNTLILETNNEGKTAQTTLDIDYGGDDIKIGINAQYLLSAIKNCNSDILDIKFDSPLNPFVIESNNEINIVMPIRLKGVDK